MSKMWNFRPDLYDQMAPYYRVPPEVFKSIRFVAVAWSFFGARIYVLGISILTWFYFSPPLEACRDFGIDWVAQIWIRNFTIALVVAGSLHLYFYTYRKQGDIDKYDPRDLSRNSRKFHFNNQVWDNMFWTLASAVSFWTFYEALLMWAYANQITTLVEFTDSPAWFVFLLFVTPWWNGFYFYWQHRMFHIPVLYKLAHNWHHKNINIGPWSGAAMHPLEHLVWLSAVLVLLWLDSHPIHAIFVLQLQMLTAITAHCGYENLHFGNGYRFRLGDFFRQLHHRFFDCNYGTVETPWDHWFNTYHDGSPEGDQRMKQRRQELIRNKAGG